jgi:hypothetical protein
MLTYMKKQLLFNLTKSLSQKMTFKMAAFAVLFLLTVQSSFAQQWDYLGKENDLTPLISAYTTVAVVNEGGAEVPYVAFCENVIAIVSSTAPAPGIAMVKKRLANGTWQQVGKNLTDRGLYTRIYTNNLNEIFVGYIDANNSSRLVVKKYNVANDSWDALNSADPNSAFVSTGNANGNYVSSQFNTTQRFSISFDANNLPYIVYTEPSNDLEIKRFDGTNWVSVGTLSDIGVSGSIAFAGTDIYVSYLLLSAVGGNSGSLKLVKFNTVTSAWDSIPVPVATTGITSLTAMRHPVMVANSSTSLCFGYMNINGTLGGNSGNNRAMASFYNITDNTWSLAPSILAGRDSTNLSLIKDANNNVYFSFIDGVTNGGFLQNEKVHFLKTGTTVWSELKNPLVIRGIDESTLWSAIGIAPGSSAPHIVYTKASATTGVFTPIVRKYQAQVPANSPVITGYSFTVTPENTTTGALAFVTLNISGSNFTGATDISLNGTSATGVPAPFTVVNDAQITYVVPGATVAPVFSQLTVTTPNGTATLNATAPSALTYAAYPATYNGNPIVVSSVTPSDLLLFTVAPALPAGLSISRGTGTISGQSTAAVASAAYTVTATNQFGFTTAVVTFATAGGAPSGLVYAPAVPVSASYTVGTAITPLVATTTNGTGATYTVNPALPAGLELNSTTGEITGTPTVAAGFKNYEVKATTSAGFTSRIIAFAVTVPLSTNSFDKLDVVKVYPNPTTDFVTVSLPNAAVVQKIAVYNSLGQLVRSENKNTVSLQNLANGNYYLTIYTAEGNYSKKIIKK